ncbi:DUF2071 domain-containing protein [Leptospira sarikeiensis]|uniref:DUF2071 domain-containing protein n=2 Tax=Leptospira sarikeiensis TaxID=2484943 RepID=A0A4R9KCV9_9LEPT|nr:DUF2071 domain-containing protein [Leptospira sarikeiensis]
MNSEHRPWPVPKGYWRMEQIWHDLLFIHWPVPVSMIRPFVPQSLDIDTFENQTWIGVVPFHMSGIRLRGLPTMPFASKFPEINLRVYVTRDGKPGVYFISLDAESFPAVKIARAFYHLPYYLADFKVSESKDQISYSSKRRRFDTRFHFQAKYGPNSDPYFSKKGSLDHWLTERYCLYANWGKSVYRCEILHEPWPLQKAEAEIFINTMADIEGLKLPDIKPILHFSKRLEVQIWGLERLK